MSYLGSDERDNLYEEMVSFLENNPPSELLYIVGKAIDDKTEDEK